MQRIPLYILLTLYFPSLFRLDSSSVPSINISASCTTIVLPATPCKGFTISYLKLVPSKHRHWGGKKVKHKLRSVDTHIIDAIQVTSTRICKLFVFCKWKSGSVWEGYNSSQWCIPMCGTSPERWGKKWIATHRSAVVNQFKSVDETACVMLNVPCVLIRAPKQTDFSPTFLQLSPEKLLPPCLITYRATSPNLF